MTTNKKQTMRQKKQALKKVVYSTAFRVLLTAFVLVFGVLYVVQTSAVSTTGYDMANLQKQITDLERENEKLDFEIAKHRSMQSIQDRLQGMDLVAADNVEYVTFAGSAVARR